MTHRIYVVILASAVVISISSKQALADDATSEVPPISAFGLAPEAPQEPPPSSVWDKMVLRFDGSYARGHVFDVPFRGAQLFTTIGAKKGPLTGFGGTDIFIGSTEAGLHHYAQHFYVGGDIELWRFRFGGAIYAGFSTFSRVSGSTGTMGTTEVGAWGEATFDVVRFESGHVPIALVVGGRAQLSATITWSPALFAGVRL